MSIPAIPKVRVLLLSQPTVGGTAVQVWQLASKLAPGRFEVTVASPGDGWLRERVVASGGRHVVIDLGREIRPLRDLRSLLAVRGVLARERPQVIHLHSSKAGFVGRLAAWTNRSAAAVVYTPHGFAFTQANRSVRGLYLSLERIAAPLADRIVCVSEAERAEALRCRVAFPDRVSLIRNGVDVPEGDSETPGILRRLIGVDTSCRVVAMVARLSRPKKPEDLLQAAARLAKRSDVPDHRIVFIGGGPLEASLRRLAERLGVTDRTVFLGERSDVPALLTDVDVLVLASVGEGMPYTLLEAMARARPVVGSNVGGIPELVLDGETGFTYTPGDSSQLTEILRRLLVDSGLGRRLGLEGRRRVREGFTTQPMIAATERLYLSLIGDQDD